MFGFSSAEVRCSCMICSTRRCRARLTGSGMLALRGKAHSRSRGGLCSQRLILASQCSAHLHGSGILDVRGKALSKSRELGSATTSSCLQASAQHICIAQAYLMPQARPTPDRGASSAAKGSDFQVSTIVAPLSCLAHPFLGIEHSPFKLPQGLIQEVG